MKNSPQVSVIIPCHNAEDFINETIESVLGQSIDNFEIIVIDDGSTDQSAKIVNSFSDPRITYLYQENAGVSAARNLGIKKANGEYIALLDADDLFLKTNLEAKLTFLKQNPTYRLVHAWEQVFESESRKSMFVAKGIEGTVTDDLLALSKKVIHSPSSVLCEKSLFLEVFSFDERLSTSADWHTWIKMSTKTKFGLIEEVLSKYRVHANQMHHNVAAMEHDTLIAYKEFKQQGIFKSNAHWRKCIAQLYMMLALSYWGKDRNIAKALRFGMLGFVNQPMLILQKLVSSIS